MQDEETKHEDAAASCAAANNAENTKETDTTNSEESPATPRPEQVEAEKEPTVEDSQEEDDEEPKKEKKGFPFLIIFIAIAIVFGLSFVPWGQLTREFAKDFNLLADIMPSDSTLSNANGFADGQEGVDPALAEAMENPMEFTSITVKNDSAGVDTIRIVAEKSPRVDGEMVIEDYTLDGKGLARLKKSFQESKQRPVRIGIIGDSYIEGDIFSQDIRELLQTQYGGKGVGYVPAHSMVAGFRQSVSQNDNGWTEHLVAKSGQTKNYSLAGEYHTSAGNAKVTYRGSQKKPTLASWDNTRVLFIAPNGGSIKITADSVSEQFTLQSSQEVQSVSLGAKTSRVTIDVNSSGLVFLGAWLEDKNGIVLDCMSMRGDSGISHRNVNADLAAQMRKWINYDLIIVEYGINALTAQQKDYSKYSEMMTQVVKKLKECYPDAEILLMGIGDRGHKSGGEVHSMPTAPDMVAAQRLAAQKGGCLFWDTREAMGGEDAIVNWRERKLVNGDYIHLNFQGGRELGTLMVNSINNSIK